MNSKIIKALPYIYLFFVAFGCLSFYSYTTSPFLTEMPSGDSAIFQVIGKGWSEGAVPYVALWDLKGPIIFFVNCLGYMMTGTATGIFILQFLALFLTLAIIYNLLRKKFSVIASCAIATLCGTISTANNLGGNGTEEYLLPLLAWAYYLIYRWLDDAEADRTREHPARYAIVYGLVLAFSLLTRLTNALGVCAAVAVISFWLMGKGSWRNLGANIIAFLAGFAVLFVPFALYFWSKGALGEMWYGTVLYNLDYAEASGTDLASIGGLARAFVHFLDTWLLLLVAVLMVVLRSRRRLATMVWLAVAVISGVWFLRGYGFPHYGIISLPLVAIAFLELRTLVEERQGKGLRRGVVALVAVYAGITVASCWQSFHLYDTLYRENTMLQTYRAFLSDVPKTYKQSFVAYNCHSDFYLYEGIRPACRFFTLQDFESQSSPSLRQKQRADFGRCAAEWIMVQGTAQRITDILEKRYRVVKADKNAGLRLYRRK